MNEKRRIDLLAIGVLLVLCTLPFADVLFSSSRFYIRDLTRYYYPTKRIIREIILQGDFPYWNRYYSAGQPMAANPEYEVFYPLQWLILLPDYDLGYRLHILVHIYVAAIGMYALLRSMELRARSAMFGALVFALGGVYVSMVNLLPILFCAAWMPLIFLFVRKLFLHRKVSDFCFAAFFLGMQGLVGEPTTILQTWFLIGSYSLYRAWYAEKRVRALVINTLFIGFLGISQLVIGAAQLIPAADHAADSARARKFEFDLVTSWSMPYARPLELVYPNVFGHIYKKGTWYWASGMYRGTASPFIFSVYLGVLAIALAVAALFVRPRGGRLMIWILACSYIIALGEHTPLFRFMYDVLGIGSIRYPEKFAFMGLVALNIFAAMMFDRLLDGDEKLHRAAVTFVAVTTSIAAVIAIFTFTHWFQPLFAKMWGLTNAVNAKQMARLASDDWTLAAIRGSVAILFLLSIRMRRQTLWFGALLVAMTIDFTPIGFEVLPRFPSRFFTAPAVVKQLPPRPETYRIFHEPDWYGGSDPAKRFFSTGDDVYWIVRNGLFPMTPASWGYQTVLERDYDKTALLPTVDFTDAMWRVRDAGKKDWAPQFMAMSNGRVRGSYRNFEKEGKRVRQKFREAIPIDFLPVSASPRYYLADQITTVNGVDNFVRKIVKGRWSYNVAFVEFPPFAPAGGSIEKVTEGPNTATIHVNSKGDNLLVASVTRHKYWTASVDGRPAHLYPTNITYQSIVIPAGRHVVKMSYRNTLVPPMVMTSLLGAALALIVGLATMRRRSLEETA